MDDLKRLVNLVTQYAPKFPPLVDPMAPESMETKLLNLIVNGEVNSDDEAALALYGQSSGSASYRMLKSRTRKRLMAHLHFFEFSEQAFRPSGINEFKCNSLLLEAQCLILVNEYKAAAKHIDQALDLARLHELNSVILKCLEQKQLVHVSLNSLDEFQETEAVLLKYQELEKQERVAHALFQRTHLRLSEHVKTKSVYLAQVPDVLRELYTLWESTGSSKVFNSYHVLSIHYLELNGHHSAISDAVAKAEGMLETGRLHPSWFNYRYNYFIRIYALLRTQQFQLGLSLAENYISFFSSQTVNWFAFMENYLLLALHARRYTLAGELLGQALGNSFIKKIQAAAKERWELYRRFLVLLHRVQPAQVQQLPKPVTKQLIKIAKDKAGYNLSVLVLDVIASFSKLSADSYDTQHLRLKNYIVKYLRGEQAERSRYFLRLLQQAIRKELRYEATKGAAAKIYAKLENTPPPGDAYADVEIVPYEHLWEVVLHVLQQRELAIQQLGSHN